MVWMAVSVLFFSLVPLAISLMGAESPFLLNTGWRLGVVVGCFLFLSAFYWRHWRLLFDPAIRMVIRQRIVSWRIFWATIGNFSYAIFALSTRSIDISIAAVLFGIWPISFIIYMWIYMWRQSRDSDTHRKHLSSMASGAARNRPKSRDSDTHRKYLRTHRKYLIAIARAIAPSLIIALAGFVFLVVNQTGEFSLAGAAFGDLAQGAGLVCAALVGGIGAASTIVWGRDLGEKLWKLDKKGDISLHPEISLHPLYLFGAVLGIATGNLFAMVLNPIFVPLSGEPIEPLPVIIGVVSGLVIQAPAAILLSKSNLITPQADFWRNLKKVRQIRRLLGRYFARRLGLNAFGFAIPVLSLIWLGLFSEIEVARVDYLIIGFAAILAANLLINFEADRLLGFKALVISLWFCGTVVYLRDSTDWGWAAESDGYFDVLFLSATVFALILSFRTARLASRSQEEDNRAFKIFRKMAELERRGVISPDAKIKNDMKEMEQQGLIRPGAKIYELILTIDEKQGRDLESSYSVARRVISNAWEHADDFGPDRKNLTALLVELDALAHSRQQGINFGEICAMFIFAGLVVGTALFASPAAVKESTGVIVEMFAMVFPAVIIFLAFNVVDLQRNRVSRILEPDRRYGVDDDYGVTFQDERSLGESVGRPNSRTAEQRISVAVGLVLIFAYAWLFLNKWEVWPQLVAWFIGLLF